MNKKNVLLICTDHWSAPLMGCAGHPVLMTPTLDQIADDGVRFTQCQSSCPVCIPARRSLMTGLFPSTHGDRVYDPVLTMPDVTTMAQAFRDAGYQAYAVGKLHVYPQRDRIGFDDVTLMEEGRYEFGVVDDYQIYLGEHGHTGEEFLHAMGNNNYHTRPWHLPEALHPTVWATREMMRQIKRRDPTRPGFFYLSYCFPHPPLVPLQTFLDMYEDAEIDMPDEAADWLDDSVLLKLLQEPASRYSKKEIIRAKKAFYAQCTLIDYQIRLLIGTLRECGILKDTIIAFTSDHGDVLFDHGMVAKRSFFRGSVNVPLIISGAPMAKWRGKVDNQLACLEDVMPTLLGLCDIPCPDTVEGIDLMKVQPRELLFGEISEGRMATRMMHDGRYKLIYYPCGNTFFLFDTQEDPKEHHNLAGKPEYAEKQAQLTEELIKNLHGEEDLSWVKDGKLVGFDAGEFQTHPSYGLFNQRGLHWPAPENYLKMVGV